MTSITFKALLNGKVVCFDLSGKVTRRDYEIFVPELEHLIEKHGKIRLLFELTDFDGWTPAAFWEETKVALKHVGDIERMAVVGNRKWHEAMTQFCNLIAPADVAFFETKQSFQAKQWLLDEINAEV